MTEEELAALIDEAVVEAIATTEQYASTATSATADGTVTASESEIIEVYVNLADETIAYAEELVVIFTELYGQDSDELVQAVAGVEQELATIADNTDCMQLCRIL